MTYYLSFIFIIFISNFALSQNRFEIILNAPFNCNDSLVISARQVRVGFEELYNFKLESSKHINDLRSMGFPSSTYSLRIQKKDTLTGILEYPIPIAFMKFDPKRDTLPKITSIIFLEKGSYKLDLPKISNKLDIALDSPANNEYKELKRQLANVYVKSVWYEEIDSLINFEEKQKILSSYIKRNPGSYIALWQIIEDYDLHHSNIIYADNLSLFSEEVKNSKLFKSFESKLNAENSTRVGKILPDIYFDNQYSLTKDNLKDYKLTFIEYWATSCSPCIKTMPKMVDLFNEFKDKGLNVISITDEHTPDGMELTNQILKKNKAAWTNFFDVDDKFKNIVNATGYPLQFLVDNNGKIITRVMGDFDEIKRTINENLK